jgi:hypothetical protein
MQAAWRRGNPDYFTARRLQERGNREQPPEPLRLPLPLSRLPWDVAQSEFGVHGADFLGVMGKVLLRPAQSEIRAYLFDSKKVVDTLPTPVAQSEIRAYPLDSKQVAGTLPTPAAQSEIRVQAG